MPSRACIAAGGATDGMNAIQIHGGARALPGGFWRWRKHRRQRAALANRTSAPLGCFKQQEKREVVVKQLLSSSLVSTALVVLALALTAGPAGRAIGAPIASNAAELRSAAAADDLVTLARRFSSGRGPCGGELGFPTDRVFPDGTRELFVVPAGKAFVITDLEGEIVRSSSAAWPVGSIGLLTATLTGAVANQQVRARVQLNGDAVSGGIATAKLQLESGVVADSGASVCLSASVLYSNGFGIALLGVDPRVHGYLIAH